MKHTVVDATLQKEHVISITPDTHGLVIEMPGVKPIILDIDSDHLRVLVGDNDPVMKISMPIVPIVPGWVFCTEGDEEEIGFEPASKYRNADEAVEHFVRHYADHFDVYFRDKNGVLNPCDAESCPSDFE